MDDILFEVLLRLPPKSVSRFRDVSPRWSHLIDTSFFRQNYTKRWQGELNLLGFFVFNKDILEFRHGASRKLSSYWWPSSCTTTTKVEVLKEPAKGFFISTCNGLVLSGLHPNYYYVCDPVSNKFDQLPRCQSRSKYDCVAFWCNNSDNNLSMNFKVIRANINYRMCCQFYRKIRIETFCSRTREWSQSMLKCSSAFQLNWSRVAATVTRSGVIYWRTMDNKLAIYDLNEEEEEDGTRHLTLIQDPCSSYHILHNSYKETSDGRLQYGECDKVDVKIFVLDKLQEQDSGHYSYKWNLRYKISFSSMLTNNPTIYGCKKFYFLSLIPQNDESIYIRAGSDKFFLYHLSTGEMEQVPYRRGPCLKLDSQCHDASEYYEIEPYYEQLWPDLSF